MVRFSLKGLIGVLHQKRNPRDSRTNASVNILPLLQRNNFEEKFQ